MTTYLPQLVAAVVVAILIWIICDEWGAAISIVETLILVMTLSLVGMLVAYVIVAVMSPDSLMERMAESGLLRALTDSLGYAMTIGLLAVILNIIAFGQIATAEFDYVTGGMELLESIIYLIVLLVSSLALMFFLNVITKLQGIVKVRTGDVDFNYGGGFVQSSEEEVFQDYGLDDDAVAEEAPAEDESVPEVQDYGL